MDGLSTTVNTETLNIVGALRRCQDQLRGKVSLDDETLQEVLMNQLVHRDYRAKAIVQITIADSLHLRTPEGCLRTSHRETS
jgi:hypothetical protein